MKLEFLNTIGYWGMVLGAGAGLAGLVASTVSAFALYRAADIEKRQSDIVIGELNQSVAIARRETEVMRRKNLELERLLANRELLPVHRDSLLNALKSLSPRMARLDVISLCGDREGYRFAEELSKVIRESGFESIASDGGSSWVEPFHGYAYGVAKSDEAAWPPVVKAFGEVGIEMKYWQPVGFASANANRIFVGLRRPYQRDPEHPTSY